MPKGSKGRTLVDKCCEACGKPFKVVKGLEHVRSCSQACGYVLRGRSNKKGTERACDLCGKPFFAREESKVYCSRRCEQRASTLRPCEVCGKPFRSPPSQDHVRTCSTECGYQIRLVHTKDKIRKTCLHCGKTFERPPSTADGAYYCSKVCYHASDELKARMERSGENCPAWKGGSTRFVVSKTGRRYGRQAPANEAEKSVRRKRAIGTATPAWAVLEKVLWFYREAERLTKETGMIYHVDHQVPLTSRIVCGLHNEFNLEVLPARLNLQKHNRRWPDMP